MLQLVGMGRRNLVAPSMGLGRGRDRSSGLHAMCGDRGRGNSSVPIVFLVNSIEVGLKGSGRFGDSVP